MENTSSPINPTHVDETKEQPVVQTPKQNNFLVILLSILLLLSISIAGFFAYQTQILVKELTLLKTVPTPESTTEPVATIDPTINWKTYVNTKNGFLLKYPIEAKESSRGADPFPNLVQIDNLKPRTGGGGGPEMEGWFIAISEPQPNSEKLSLTDWINKTGILGQPDPNIDYKLPKLTATKIGGKDAMVWGTPEAITNYVVQNKPDSVIFILINRIGVSESEIKTVDQILSTFKFID